MSFALLKNTIKNNFVLFVIFLNVLAFYTYVMIIMYRPESLDALNAMFEVLPKDMMSALGFIAVFTDFLGYLASWLYSLIFTVFPMIYCIILSNRLVARTVDNGSIVCLLSTPLSRSKIIVTQAMYALLSLTSLFICLFFLILFIAQIQFPGQINIEKFISLNTTVLLVNLAVMSITFFFSCLFNETKYSLGFGSGIPIGFLLINMIANASPEANTMQQIFKKISIYGWYDPIGIANGISSATVNIIYISIIITFISLSIIVFKKKRLPI